MKKKGGEGNNGQKVSVATKKCQTEKGKKKAVTGITYNCFHIRGAETRI